MNKKLQLAVLASMLLAGCQTLTSQNEVATDDQPTMQTAPVARSARDRSEELSTLSVWQRASQSMKMDIPQQADVITYRNWYLKHPRYLNTVTERAAPYLFLVMEELDKRNMPAELALLPIVESAYNPLARSPSNAVGLWQFTPGTGVRYGLKRDAWYDGRRDVHASTIAALDYLAKLHGDFNGDWFNAIAAYNAGEGRIQKAVAQSIRQGKQGDFWSLNLPRQTTEYVPRLLALADIIKNADRYGVKLPPHPNRQQWQLIDAGGQVSLAVVADMAGISTNELKRLNPGYLRNSTSSSGPHHLLVPKRGARELELALAELPRQQRLKPGEQFALPSEDDHLMLAETRRTKVAGKRQARTIEYKVKPGDSLWSISKAHGVTKQQLLSWNRNASKALKPGQVLKLQTSSSNRKARAYEVRHGDSLSSIAQQFEVSVDDLVRWNSLENRHSLKPGQKLVINDKRSGA